MTSNAYAAGTMAKDADARGVAAKGGDVLLYPSERNHLVPYAVISAALLADRAAYV